MKLIIKVIIFIAIGIFIFANLFSIYFLKNYQSVGDIYRLYIKAIKNKDISLCDQIKDNKYINSEWIRAQCYSNVGIGAGDTSICDKISPDREAEKAVCYSDIGIKNKNISICEFISFNSTNLDVIFRRTNCFYGVAFELGDYNLCNKITGKNYPAQCFGEIAAKNNDLEYCKNLPNTQNKDDCFYGYIKSKKDLSICPLIQNSKTKDFCYFRIAAGTQNVTICGNILNPDLKINCKIEVNDAVHEKFPLNYYDLDIGRAE